MNSVTRVKAAPEEAVIKSMSELGTLVRQVRKGQHLTQEDISGLAGR